jgi:hypothetical protein
VERGGKTALIWRLKTCHFFELYFLTLWVEGGTASCGEIVGRKGWNVVAVPTSSGSFPFDKLRVRMTAETSDGNNPSSFETV